MAWRVLQAHAQAFVLEQSEVRDERGEFATVHHDQQLMETRKQIKGGTPWLPCDGVDDIIHSRDRKSVGLRTVIEIVIVVCETPTKYDPPIRQDQWFLRDQVDSSSPRASRWVDNIRVRWLHLFNHVLYDGLFQRRSPIWWASSGRGSRLQPNFERR